MNTASPSFPARLLARALGPEPFEGATLSLPDGKEVPFPTGRVSINKRDVPHVGFKIAGDKTLKMLTVHIVDKGKPLIEPAH